MLLKINRGKNLYFNYSSKYYVFLLQKSEEQKAGGLPQTGHVLVSADFNGCIKVFVHKAKPKHSSLPASALA